MSTETSSRNSTSRRVPRLDAPPQSAPPVKRFSAAAARPGWYEALRQHLSRYEARGLLFSIVLHTLVLIFLSLFFFEQVTGPAPFGMEIGGFEDGGGGGEGNDEIIDTRLDVDLEPPVDIPVEVAPVAIADPQAIEVAAPTMTPVDVTEPAIGGGNFGGGSGEGIGDGEGDGTGGGGDGIEVDAPRFAVPDKGQVVKKGSFTVWTVPEDPDPGQPYDIHILIDLPERLKRYSHADLSGTVIGTDGYRQRLPWDFFIPDATTTIDADGNRTVVGRTGDLPLRSGQALLIVRIPRAAALVRDTIEIRSRLLREKQTLKIVF